MFFTGLQRILPTTVSDSKSNLTTSDPISRELRPSDLGTIQFNLKWNIVVIYKGPCPVGNNMKDIDVILSFEKCLVLATSSIASV